MKFIIYLMKMRKKKVFQKKKVKITAKVAVKATKILNAIK